MKALRRIRPNLAGLVATLFFAPLLFSLGLWQYQRGEEKAALFEQYDRLESEAPEPFSTLGERAFSQQMKFAPVRLRHYRWVDDAPDIYLSNRLHRGQTGVWVYRAASLPGQDRWLLVNLGWLPSERGASEPRDSVPASPEGEQTARLAGWPEVGIRIGDVDSLTVEQGRVLTPYLDAQLAERWLGHPVMPITLQLTEASDRWVRAWRPDLLPASRHYGYSVQWFGLFLTLMVIFFLMSWRRGRRLETQDHD